jgi:hypothetical protein
MRRPYLQLQDTLQEDSEESKGPRCGGGRREEAPQWCDIDALHKQQSYYAMTSPFLVRLSANARAIPTRGARLLAEPISGTPTCSPGILFARNVIVWPFNDPSSTLTSGLSHICNLKSPLFGLADSYLSLGPCPLSMISNRNHQNWRKGS